MRVESWGGAILERHGSFHIHLTIATSVEKMAWFLASVMLSSFLISFASSEANHEKDQPQKISKSSLCQSMAEHSFCSDNFNVVTVVEQLTENTELNEEQKNVGENSGRCAEAMRKEICSSPSPICLKDASGNDSGRNQLCRNLRNSCSFLNDEQQCLSYFKREYTDMTCKTVSNALFKGICPKPVKKVMCTLQANVCIQVFQTKILIIALHVLEV